MRNRSDRSTAEAALFAPLFGSQYRTRLPDGASQEPVNGHDTRREHARRPEAGRRYISELKRQLPHSANAGQEGHDRTQRTEETADEHAERAPLSEVLAFGESLAFVSLLSPETSILLGVGGLVGTAAFGAALGDWLSYWLRRSPGLVKPDDIQKRVRNAALRQLRKHMLVRSKIAPSGNETCAPEPLEELQRSKNGDDDHGDEHQVVGMQRPEAE